MVKHWNIQVWGEVQGVFFRYSAKEKAEELHLTGFAHNERDGSVYIEVEGAEEGLREFAEWCKKGPENAQVRKIETEGAESKHFADFSLL